MWQNLLPGLREFRTPLAAGFVWLFTLWLTLGAMLARGTLRGRVAELANWAGKPVVFAALTFVAYLVGVLSMALTSSIEQRARRLVNTRIGRLVPRYWIEKRTEETLEGALLAKLSQMIVDNSTFRELSVSHLSAVREQARREGKAFIHESFSDIGDDLARDLLQDEPVRSHLVYLIVEPSQYLEHIRADAAHLARRLAGRDEHIYDEYDRLRTEAWFRVGMALPLGSLFCVLTVQDSWWWLFGLAASVVLAYVGGFTSVQAERGLAAAVAAGRVELPALQDIPINQIRLAPYADLIE